MRHGPSWINNTSHKKAMKSVNFLYLAITAIGLSLGLGSAGQSQAMEETSIENMSSQSSETYEHDRQFYIVLASHRKREKAQISLNKFEPKVDFLLHLREVDIDGQSWFRVLSSQFTDVTEVESRLAQIKANVASRAWYLSTTETYTDLEDFSGAMSTPPGSSLAEEDEEKKRTPGQLDLEVGDVEVVDVDVMNRNAPELSSAMTTEANKDSVYPFKHFGRLESQYSKDDQ